MDLKEAAVSDFHCKQMLNELWEVITKLDQQQWAALSLAVVTLDRVMRVALRSVSAEQTEFSAAVRECIRRGWFKGLTETVTLSSGETMPTDVFLIRCRNKIVHAECEQLLFDPLWEIAGVTCQLTYAVGMLCGRDEWRQIGG